MSAQNTGSTSVDNQKQEFDESMHNSNLIDISTNFDETIDNVSTNLFDKSIQQNESRINGDNTDQILTSSPLPHGKPFQMWRDLFQVPTTSAILT